MDTKRMQETVVIKMNSKYTRKLPDPTDRNIQHYTILVNAKDLINAYDPYGSPSKPIIFPSLNVRGSENKAKGVYRDTKASLVTDDGRFHLLNRGIVVLASTCVVSANDTVTLTFQEGAFGGIIDGGHTYSITQDAVKEKASLSRQYVRLDVVTGIEKEDDIVDIVESRNSSMQVKTVSILELNGGFNWLKDQLKEHGLSEMVDGIGYDENSKKSVHIQDLIRQLAMFNPEHIKDHGNAKRIYSGKARALELYEDDIKPGGPKTFLALSKILPEVLSVIDEVAATSFFVDKAQGLGRPGPKPAIHKIHVPYDNLLLFSKLKTSDPYVRSIFKKKTEGDCLVPEFVTVSQDLIKKTNYSIHDSINYPILYAIGRLVKMGEGGFYKWQYSFDRVQKIIRRALPELIAESKERIEKSGGNIMIVGRDEETYKEFKRIIGSVDLKLENEELKRGMALQTA